MKIERKRKLDSFFFKEKITLKHLKIIRSYLNQLFFKKPFYGFKLNRIKGTVMQMEKALINDRLLRVLKVF